MKKKLKDFLFEEEGNISRANMLTVGTMSVVTGSIFAGDVKHVTHKSHVSHISHQSHSINIFNEPQIPSNTPKIN